MMFKQLCRLQRYTFLHDLPNVYNTFLHELSSYAYTFLHELSSYYVHDNRFQVRVSIVLSLSLVNSGVPIYLLFRSGCTQYSVHRQNREKLFSSYTLFYWIMRDVLILRECFTVWTRESNSLVVVGIEYVFLHLKHISIFTAGNIWIRFFQ